MEERYSSKLVTDLMLTRDNNGRKEILLALRKKQVIEMENMNYLEVM